MKTFIIIQREFLSRVKKKSFIIMTLLTPLLFIGMAVLIGYISVKSISQKTVVVLDNSGLFGDQLTSSPELQFEFRTGDVASHRQDVATEKTDALLVIPRADQLEAGAPFELFSKKQLGLQFQSKVESQLNNIVREHRLRAMGIASDQLERVQQSKIQLNTTTLEGRAGDSVSAFVIGYAAGFILYFFMLFYGMSVMRSVMEEKTNRIAEIIVSSVTPFQLMLGKIVGVALVGLTQFLIWLGIILISGGALAGGMGAGLFSDPGMLQQTAQAGTDPDFLVGLQAIISDTNWAYIIFWFLFYFLGGYFLYAALFASVGSLVNEDPQESQQFTLPITLPIILGFVLMTSAVNDPNSGLAVFGSLFPLTSPIVMMARIPFGVPAWQLLSSAALLILGFILTTWMAGKIYRTGILLYGKKITLKEVGKWIVRKS